jgi:putative transposase
VRRPDAAFQAGRDFSTPQPSARPSQMSFEPPNPSLSGWTTKSKPVRSGGLLRKCWPHAPVHRLSENGIYFITAGTYLKLKLFAGPERLALLEGAILELAARYCWQLEAWAVFPNHYHYVARGVPDSKGIRLLISHTHTHTARELNRLDGEPGRRVWYNFWDTRLTYERSYFARLNYTHQNAVKHGLVPVANQYQWCSAAWFERTAPTSMVDTIYSFKTDRLEVPDDF